MSDLSQEKTMREEVAKQKRERREARQRQIRERKIAKAYARRKQSVYYLEDAMLYDGVEPLPRWECLASTVAQMRTLCTGLKRERKLGNSKLVGKLEEVVERCTEEAKARARRRELLEKKLLVETLPKKRSSRITENRMREIERERVRAEKAREEETRRRVREEEERERAKRRRMAEREALRVHQLLRWAV